MNVIVLDGNQRSALAVTRSLGKRGITVTVGAETVPSLSSCSKYCSHSFLYPSPETNSRKFLEAIKEYVENKSDVVLFPITDVTVSEVLKRRDELGAAVKIPFSDYSKYAAASDKLRLFLMARDLNIPMPRTLFSSEFNENESLLEESGKLEFPLVIKPANSRIPKGDKWMHGVVRYARDLDSLRVLLDDEPCKSHPFIIQERIEGPGIGIFLLMQDGEVIAKFAHRRIREKPPSGGVSVLCESMKSPPMALESAARLLGKLGFSGVAMVEFKRDRRDNVPKLMEINARFWGSLELAIAAGVDFPFLLYCLATEQKIGPSFDYKIGIKSRWELGDLDHLLIRMRKKKCELFLPADAPSRFGVIRDFVLDFFRPSIRNEVLKLDDPGPFLFEVRKYIKDLM
jgi:predicted ATP-grasp superfamily ATP-dependent carboligase